ncbi:septum formation family protein [Nocardiopsis quinghaiensis]|uniref:septum formation family protein n=1 Tax=Nocardiopsis quinghaiensis TaxID=464995 RepID=UPI001239E718|nr:septum formation family protein [Nocardiopsis quinghaiensis]
MSSVSPVLRTVGVSVLAAGAAFSLSGCGVLLSALGGGNVMELNVGECFSEAEMNAALGSEEEVSDVPLIDCAEEHDSEFFFSHEMTGDEFPGAAAISTEAEEVCYGDNFTDFVGVSYEESEIFAAYLAPTSQTWDQLNDREILCYVTTVASGETGEPVTGTLEGANR